MKKLAIFLFVGILILGMTGCTNKKNSSSQNEQEVVGPRYTLKLSIQGEGQLAFGRDGEELVFNDEYPIQSTQINEVPDTKLVIGAQANDGYHFVHWLKDGVEYSKDPQIVLTLKEDMELVAVFDVS